MPKRRVRRHEVTQPPNESYRLIPLTQNQNAIVDSADFEWLSQWNWYAHWNPHTRSFYARRNSRINGKKGILRMHRILLCCGPNEEGDHHNHDTLDNRRENLRRCTRLENAKNIRTPATNTSGYKGVYRSGARWRVMIRVNRKLVHYGRFSTAENAARAYNE